MAANLDIKHLKMIYTIANSDSVKKAADTLCISQPALSSRIKEAERRLDCQLFVRRGRKLVITHAGDRLLQSASRIIEELERAEHDISRLSSGVEQVLRVSLPQYASFKWMPEGIKKFSKQFPKIEIEITAQTATDAIKSISEGNADVAITANPDKGDQFNSKLYATTHLFEDEMVALVPKNHPLCKKEFLTVNDFSNETYITTSTVPERGREYELFFKPEGDTPYKVIQVGFIDAILELVQAGMGLTIMNRWVLESLGSQYELEILPLTKSGLHFDWYSVCLNDEDITKPALFLNQFLNFTGDVEVGE